MSRLTFFNGLRRQRRDAKSSGVDNGKDCDNGGGMRDFFFHVHVPKCAGTTFNAILKANFGSAFFADYGLLNDYQYSKEQVMQILRGFPHLQCVASHHLSIHLPFENDVARVRAIVFARRPADWVASTYFYNRGQPHTAGQMAKQVDFATYVEKRFQAAAPGSIGQTRLLAHVGGDEGFDHIRNTVEKHDVLLFPVDGFDESCVVLETLFPAFFRDCSFARQNVSVRDQASLPDLEQRIEKVLAADFKLYAFAQSQLEERIQKLFPNRNAFEERLGEFRRRRPVKGKKKRWRKVLGLSRR